MEAMDSLKSPKILEAYIDERNLSRNVFKKLYRIKPILYGIGIYEVLAPFDREPFCHVRPDSGVIGPMFSREIKREGPSAFKLESGWTLLLGSRHRCWL